MLASNRREEACLDYHITPFCFEKVPIIFQPFADKLSGHHRLCLQVSDIMISFVILIFQSYGSCFQQTYPFMRENT